MFHGFPSYWEIHGEQISHVSSFVLQAFPITGSHGKIKGPSAYFVVPAGFLI
jgi:hypothetical protein